ncbi:MAG: class I SAM-dependent methyltransferase [Rubrimonas sp.]|uniref:class I SAM-dependent methyltransferase n=1 Tax=Rubrimonas sp. TaxID=2036015 RepID=UPI002FDDAC66
MADTALAALIHLHEDAPRQGPGEAAVLDRMIDRLKIGDGARAADLGCGSGATALRLAVARSFDVLALDAAAPFIDRLRARLKANPPQRGSVEPVIGDMAAPPVSPGALDLIVSEGAAYSIGFANALKLWRPLVRRGGGLVVSECVWFGADRPASARAHWEAGYPGMGSIADAVARAEAAGWRLVAAERLRAEAWRESYHRPLAARIAALRAEAASDAALAQAIAEAESEIALFDATCDAWGYVYLALDAG